MSTITCPSSLSVALVVRERTRGLYEGTRRSVRACCIVRSALQVSVSHVLLLSSFGDQAGFSSSFIQLATVAISPVGGAVVSSCSVETGEISASGWSWRLRMRLPSCRLFSLRAMVTSLRMISLWVASSVICGARSSQAIHKIRINEGVGVFSRGQINLQPATSGFTQKYSNHLWPRITS